MQDVVQPWNSDDPGRRRFVIADRVLGLNLQEWQANYLLVHRGLGDSDSEGGCFNFTWRGFDVVLGGHLRSPVFDSVRPKVKQELPWPAGKCLRADPGQSSR